MSIKALDVYTELKGKTKDFLQAISICKDKCEFEKHDKKGYYFFIFHDDSCLMLYPDEDIEYIGYGVKIIRPHLESIREIWSCPKCGSRNLESEAPCHIEFMSNPDNDKCTIIRIQTEKGTKYLSSDSICKCKDCGYTSLIDEFQETIRNLGIEDDC